MGVFESVISYNTHDLWNNRDRLILHLYSAAA